MRKDDLLNRSGIAPACWGRCSPFRKDVGTFLSMFPLQIVRGATLVDRSSDFTQCCYSGRPLAHFTGVLYKMEYSRGQNLIDRFFVSNPKIDYLKIRVRGNKRNS